MLTLLLRLLRQIPWKDDDRLLAAWRDGQTGYPWIDAAMVQVFFTTCQNESLLLVLHIMLPACAWHHVIVSFVDAVTEVGLDASPCKTCCRMLPHSGGYGA